MRPVRAGSSGPCRCRLWRICALASVCHGSGSRDGLRHCTGSWSWSGARRVRRLWSAAFRPGPSGSWDRGLFRVGGSLCSLGLFVPDPGSVWSWPVFYERKSFAVSCANQACIGKRRKVTWEAKDFVQIFFQFLPTIIWKMTSNPNKIFRISLSRSMKWCNDLGSKIFSL